jgi:hypothetical protein
VSPNSTTGYDGCLIDLLELFQGIGVGEIKEKKKKDGSPMNFLARLALNHDPPDLSLPSS